MSVLRPSLPPFISIIARMSRSRAGLAVPWAAAMRIIKSEPVKPRLKSATPPRMKSRRQSFILSSSRHLVLGGAHDQVDQAAGLHVKLLPGEAVEPSRRLHVGDHLLAVLCRRGDRGHRAQDVVPVSPRGVQL